MTASSISRQLHRAGFRPVPASSKREGLKVTAAFLDLPLDQTEQGLTPSASDKIDEFVRGFHPDYAGSQS